ncbi:c-type cytochrome [Patulibacter minatonensis]|uniref:c-type cytochrome n=1 Tax=Patulibacter minatonensis TaxID=298163 RepID=UPI00047D8D8E|nr:c-type cytochrome [Patulibacter minatonensis]
MQRRALTTLGALSAALVLASCGSESVKTNVDNGPLKGEKNPIVLKGANLFAERCSGCHTLAVAGTQGGASKIKDRERTDGPNFDLRAETTGSVLYALHNGGYSGAIMPANIAVGDDADAIAAFLCKYTGLKAAASSSPTKAKTAAERCADKNPPVAGSAANEGASQGEGAGDAQNTDSGN